MQSHDSTMTTINTVMRFLPDKIIYTIFSLGISTKYSTIPGFLYFVCNHCHTPDYFTGIIASILENSKLILKDDPSDKDRVRVILFIHDTKLEDTLISPEFFDSLIFIKFVKILLKFNIKFLKIEIESSSDPFKTEVSNCLKIAYLKLIKSYFVKGCCKGLYFNTYFPVELISSYAEIAKSATISIHSKNDSAALLNLWNLELLRINFGKGTKDSDIKEFKKWIKLVSRTSIKRIIIIKLCHMCKISDFFIQAITEIGTQNKLIEIQLILDGATPLRLKNLRLIQNHIDTIIILTSTPEYFGAPSTYDILNSSTSLHKIVDFTAAKFKKWDVESLTNKQINDIELHCFGQYTSTSIDKLKHLKNLKKLNFSTNSCDLSIFQFLDDLQLNFSVSQGIKALNLPLNLKTLSLNIYGLIDPKIGFQIKNKDKLKNLKQMHFEIKSNISESIPKLIDSLPKSIVTLSFKLPEEFSNSRSQIGINFIHLINLENLRISSFYLDPGEPYHVKSTLQIFSLPNSLRELNFAVHPCIKSILPNILPISIQQLSLSVYHESLSNFFGKYYNFSDLKNLSSLNIETWFYNSFDLSSHLPESILYFKLTLKYDLKRSSSTSSLKKCLVEVPFESRSLLKYFEIKLDDKKFDVELQGNMTEYDYYKLKVIKPLAVASNKSSRKLRLFG